MSAEERLAPPPDLEAEVSATDGILTVKMSGGGVKLTIDIDPEANGFDHADQMLSAFPGVVEA